MIDLQKVCYAYEHEVALRYIDLHIEKGDSWSFRDRMDVENQHLSNC